MNMKTLKNKLLVSIVLFSFVFTSMTAKSNMSSSGETIDISQIVTNTNGVGIVLDQDISSYLTANSYAYILLALYQNSVCNGFYIAGFDINESANIIYKLGELSDTTGPWFNGNDSLILNYGSVIYIDILDYLVAFGTPDQIKGMILLSTLSVEDIQFNINNIMNDFQDYFVIASTSTSSSSDSSTSLSSSSTKSITASPGYDVTLVVMFLVFYSVIIKGRKKK